MKGRIGQGSVMQDRAGQGRAGECKAEGQDSAGQDMGRQICPSGQRLTSLGEPRDAKVTFRTVYLSVHT